MVYSTALGLKQRSINYGCGVDYVDTSGTEIMHFNTEPKFIRVASVVQLNRPRHRSLASVINFLPNISSLPKPHFRDAQREAAQGLHARAPLRGRP